MMLVGCVEKLTKARSLTRDRMRSECHIVFKVAMSLGNNRGCSRALVR